MRDGAPFHYSKTARSKIERNINLIFAWWNHFLTFGMISLHWKRFQKARRAKQDGQAQGLDTELLTLPRIRHVRQTKPILNTVIPVDGDPFPAGMGLFSYRWAVIPLEGSRMLCSGLELPGSLLTGQHSLLRCEVAKGLRP